MLLDCKYRLSCNWCDKYDRMCEAVLFEIYKKQDEVKCKHDWELKAAEPTDYTDGYGKRYWNYKYVCEKCGKEEFRFVTNN